jgi:hypothetical protein
MDKRAETIEAAREFCISRQWQFFDKELELMADFCLSRDAWTSVVEAATVAWSEMGDDWFSPRPEEAREKFWDAFSAGWNARAALEAGKAVDEKTKAIAQRVVDADVVELTNAPFEANHITWDELNALAEGYLALSGRTGDAG